jgi:FMN reductase
MVMLVVGVVGSPNLGGRTRVAVDAVLRGAAGEGAETKLFELAGDKPDEVRAALERADAVVFGSPVYRAEATAKLKALLEGTPRGMWGETSELAAAVRSSKWLRDLRPLV